MMLPKGEVWVCRKCGNTVQIKEEEKKGIVEKGKRKETIVVEKEEINLPTPGVPVMQIISQFQV